MGGRFGTLVALAVGVGAGLGMERLTGSRGLALALGFLVGYLVWSELNDRALRRNAAGPRHAPGTPLLFRPEVRRRVVGILAILAVVSLTLTEFLTGDLDTDSVRRWVLDLGVWGPVLLILVLALAMIVAPIPNPPFMIAAGLVWGTLLGVVYAVAGQLLGAAVIFWISRKAGRRFIPRLIGEKGARRVDRLAREMGPQIVFWWRMMPVSFDFAAYAAGLTTMRFRQFIALVFLGSIVPTSVIVGFGDSFNHSWTARGVSAGLIVLAVAVPATIFYFRYRHQLPQLGELMRAFAADEADERQRSSGAAVDERASEV